MLRSSLVRLCLGAVVMAPAGAMAAEQTDLREFKIGMAVSVLPGSGYDAFACASEPSKKLDGWADYKTCPPGANGAHAVSFRYAGDDEGDKTQVGGQPVKLSLLINDDARVVGLTIDTDPHVRLYLHKKAYLFGQQVKARFGEDGWVCRKAEPTSTEQPIGGVFIKEHCEKTTATRHYVLDRQLFRDPAKELRDFTDATQLAILLAGQAS